MNRNTLIGWAVLMALFLGWTQYKGHQAREVKHQMDQRAADSLAKLPAAPIGAVAAPSRETVKASSSDQASLPAAERRVITVQTGRFTAVLDARGARIAELRIPGLEGKAVYNPVLISPDGEGALTLSLNNQALDNVVWSTETKETFLDADSRIVSVAFSTVLENGARVKRTYTFDPAKPFIHHTFSIEGGEVQSYALIWKGGLEETEKIVDGQGVGLTSGYLSELVYDNGVNAQRASFTGDKSFNAESGVIRWVGLRRKYVAVILDFGGDIQDRVDAVGIAGASKTSPKRYSLKVAGNGDESGALNFDFVVLPLQYTAVKAMGRNYEQILFSGWEWFFRADIWYVKLCGLVLHLLNWFHSWIPNYGVAIILLTLLVRLITLPLSVTQTRQSAKMALHQPEIKKIQEKHKGDRQKTQAEIMAYYQKMGINPMAPVLGCFPALLQMPVFIALFNVLGRAVELHQMPFFFWVHDLSRPDVVLDTFKIPFLFPLGLTILPFFMAFTMWLQMKMTIKDPNQKAMIWLMPIMMFVFSGSFPSGLVLYWTTSNLFTLAQNRIFGSAKQGKPPVLVSGTGKSSKPGRKPVSR